MPRRIILHAGFHKTGTSTIQATLRENRVALKKQIALRLRWHLQDIVSAARGYSTNHDPLTLIKLQSRFGSMINALPGMPRRTLVISAEELCGHLPGRAELTDYRAAPVLVQTYLEIMQTRFPDAEILVYLSVREPEPWLASAYWEHVKSSDMTLDFDAFRDIYQAAADLRGIAKNIADQVDVPVHVHTLEKCRNLPLGPADPLLDLCDIPAAIRSALTPVAPVNTRLDSQTLAAMLAANRAHIDPAARKAAKDAILAQSERTL